MEMAWKYDGNASELSGGTKHMAVINNLFLTLCAQQEQQDVTLSQCGGVVCMFPSHGEKRGTDGYEHVITRVSDPPSRIHFKGYNSPGVTPHATFFAYSPDQGVVAKVVR
ncbi:hypothetical protein KSC_031820 [Ktedonobacter sp. SOSP1-52]|nr:hypothetical protein KSC_031820 [Ktedonobacter sp. SOSP1-52]